MVVLHLFSESFQIGRDVQVIIRDNIWYHVFHWQEVSGVRVQRTIQKLWTFWKCNRPRLCIVPYGLRLMKWRHGSLSHSLCLKRGSAVNDNHVATGYLVRVTWNQIRREKERDVFILGSLCVPVLSSVLWIITATNYLKPQKMLQSNVIWGYKQINSVVNFVFRWESL